MNVGSMYRLLHLFTLGGHTFTFHNAVAVTDNETVLVVKYAARSDGITKEGTFLKAALVGYSYVEVESDAIPS